MGLFKKENSKTKDNQISVGNEDSSYNFTKDIDMMTTSEKVEYVKDLIKQLEANKKHTLLLITFNLALFGLIIKSVLLSEAIVLNFCERKFIFITMICLVIGTGAFINWYFRLNLLRIKATTLFITKKITEACKIHYPDNGYYEKYGIISIIGNIFTIIAILILVFEILYRIW